MIIFTPPAYSVFGPLLLLWVSRYRQTERQVPCCPRIVFTQYSLTEYFYCLSFAVEVFRIEPCEVVVDVLRRHALEGKEERLHLAVVIVDVLDVVNALFAFSSLDLDHVKAELFPELPLGGTGVRA